jgi:hypothetical protein
MSNNFDWQTEEDVNWDDLPGRTPYQVERSRRRTWPQRLWWPLLIGGLLLAGGWLALQQVTARVAEVEAEVTADLLASHQLLLRSAAEQDEDVVLSLLSGRDTGWTQGQLEIMTAGLWLERPSLGLTYLETPADGVTVTLSSDLYAADMVYDVVYQTDTAETITLQRTAVYRRGADRWLFSPPEGDYWGGWEEAEFPRLTLQYPAREAEIAERLGADLSQAVAALCREIDGFDCPADFRVRLQLDHRPQSLLALNTAVLPFHGVAFHYQLPTPALVGLPQDEAAYDALWRGYAARLLSGVVADHTAYSCCRQAAIFQVLVDYQLSQLGLVDWPVTAQLLREVAGGERSLDSNTLAHLWWAEDTAVLNSEDGWMAYLLVAYLLHDTAGPSAFGWQKMLGVRQELYAWLETIEMINWRGGYQVLADQVWGYTYIQSLAQTATDSPPPLPDQELLLACMPTMTSIPASVQLLRYTPATDQWGFDGNYEGYPQLYPDSEGAGVILINHTADTLLRRQISRWHEGRLRPLSLPDLDFNTQGSFSPDGRFLSAYQVTNGSAYPILLDLADCSVSGCRLYPLAGDIRWSPDGQRSLIVAYTNRPGVPVAEQALYRTLVDVWLADERGQPLVEEPITAVRYPFWVDDQTFGYIDRDEDVGDRIMLVTGSRVRPLLDMSQISQQWQVPDHTWSILSVIPNPHHKAQFLLLLDGPDLLHLLAFDTSSRAIIPVIAQERGDFPPLVAVAGDYLLLYFVSGDAGSNYNQLWLYDMWQGTNHIYYDKPFERWFYTFAPRYAISGDWLALLLSERHLLLALPRHGYSQVVVHEGLADCHGLAWVSATD